MEIIIVILYCVRISIGRPSNHLRHVHIAITGSQNPSVFKKKNEEVPVSVFLYFSICLKTKRERIAQLVDDKKTERQRTKKGGVGLVAGLIFNRIYDNPVRVSDPSVE